MKHNSSDGNAALEYGERPSSMRSRRSPLPLGLVEHELGHLLGGILSGASEGIVYHDEKSWRCDLAWPVAQPTEEQTICPHIIGTYIGAQHASADDKLLAAVVPAHFHEKTKELATAVQSELDRLGPEFLKRVQKTLLFEGSFSMRRVLRTN
jgi:hypothetical protein